MGSLIQIPAEKPVEAYVATPTNSPKGAIIVIHEVWGLADHIKSVADRCAEIGYLALAPNLLDDLVFVSGEIPQLQKDLFDPVRRTAVQPRLRELMAPTREPGFAELTTRRLQACFNYLYDLPESQQNVSVLGFCFGGSYGFTLAVVEPRLKLALPFYGHADQSSNELTKINCPVQAFYGQNDERLISQLPELTERMQKAKVDFSSTVYPDCGHAFFNDSNPNAYNAAAASDAWKKVQEELAKTA